MAKQKGSSSKPPEPPPGVSADDRPEIEGIRRGEVMRLPGEVIYPPEKLAELAESVEGEGIELAESESTTLAGRVAISLPTLNMSFGYVRRRHDVTLTREQAKTWRAIAEGLQQQERKLGNGKHVATVTDAIRYVAENVESST